MFDEREERKDHKGDHRGDDQQSILEREEKNMDSMLASVSEVSCTKTIATVEKFVSITTKTRT